MTYNEYPLLYRLCTIVTSRYKAISLLPFISEKYTWILFSIKMYTSDSGKRKILIYNNIKYHFQEKRN